MVWLQAISCVFFAFLVAMPIIDPEMEFKKPDTPDAWTEPL